jgi:hypothetical protein
MFVPTAPVPTSFGPCCVNCASANCDERSRATKIRIDAQNDLNDPTCEIGQPRGVIEPPLDRVVGRADGRSQPWVGLPCVRGYGSLYTTSRAAVIAIACQKAVQSGQHPVGRPANGGAMIVRFTAVFEGRWPGCLAGVQIGHFAPQCGSDHVRSWRKETYGR